MSEAECNELERQEIEEEEEEERKGRKNILLELEHHFEKVESIVSNSYTGIVCHVMHIGCDIKGHQKKNSKEQYFFEIIINNIFQFFTINQPL